MKVGMVNNTSAVYQGSSVERVSAPAAQAVQSEAKVDTKVEKVSVPEAVEVKDSQKNGTESLKKAVEQINSKVSNSEVVFGMHEATNRVTIKLVDKETKDVIREFPPEETLDMIAKIWEIAGLMVDERR